MHEPLSVPEVEHLDIEIRARVEPGAFDLPAPLRVLFCSSCACVHKASAGLANAGVLATGALTRRACSGPR
jgi:hypothetical protein